jgi:hypothetical protein
MALCMIAELAAAVPDLDPGSRLALQPTVSECATSVLTSLLACMSVARGGKHKQLAAKAVAAWLRVPAIASSTSIMSPGEHRCCMFRELAPESLVFHEFGLEIEPTKYRSSIPKVEPW